MKADPDDQFNQFVVQTFLKPVYIGQKVNYSKGHCLFTESLPMTESVTKPHEVYCIYD